MKGIEFVVDETGDRKAVLIDLAEHAKDNPISPEGPAPRPTTAPRARKSEDKPGHLRRGC